MQILLAVLVAVLLLAGCGTTGKNVESDLAIYDNENCLILILPAIETSSGDAANTSANRTDTVLKDLIKLPDKLAAAASALEAAGGTVAAGKILDEVAVLDPVESETTTPVVETISLRPIDNRSFEWLPETGAAYGKNVLFVFDNDCGQLLVPDCSVSHTPSGNVSDHNQIVFFCGTDFAPGSAEYNNGRASIFTAPGCVASKVTITRE